MLFDFFKILFTKPAKEPDPQPEEAAEEHVYHVEENRPPKIVKQKPIKPAKPDIIETAKEMNMSEIFLVVIDTTGRTEAKNFQPGLQNFYFIHAQDEETAKQIVLSTFRKRPALLSQLQYAVKATRLSSIVKTVGPGANFWTYIPFGGQRLPGQQGVPPKPEQLLRQNEYGEASSQSYVPPAPVGGEVVTSEDLKGVQFSGADAKVVNKFRQGNGPVAPLPEESAPLNPTQEQLLQQVMLQNKMLMEQLAKQNEKPAKKPRKAAPAAPSVESEPPQAE